MTRNTRIKVDKNGGLLIDINGTPLYPTIKEVFEIILHLYNLEEKKYGKLGMGGDLFLIAYILPLMEKRLIMTGVLTEEGSKNLERVKINISKRLSSCHPGYKWGDAPIDTLDRKRDYKVRDEVGVDEL
jgi:hypothetical protein